LPGSIQHNLTFGPRLGGTTARPELEALVESSLRSADLWDEVKDRLRSPASALSGGQQQRLCIARALALSPEVILLDEPCSGLDPISTARIEQMMRLLQTRLTWVIVTNNTKQAARVSDRTSFLLAGELVEDGPTSSIFTTPKDRRTADYVEGRFG
jgi:phosphate transport system ATP-binding protein